MVDLGIEKAGELNGTSDLCAAVRVRETREGEKKVIRSGRGAAKTCDYVDRRGKNTAAGKKRLSSNYLVAERKRGIGKHSDVGKGQFRSLPGRLDGHAEVGGKAGNNH